MGGDRNGATPPQACMEGLEQPLFILKVSPSPSEQGLQQGEISARAKPAWLSRATWDLNILWLLLGNPNKAASAAPTWS